MGHGGVPDALRSQRQWTSGAIEASLALATAPSPAGLLLGFPKEPASPAAAAGGAAAHPLPASGSRDAAAVRGGRAGRGGDELGGASQSPPARAGSAGGSSGSPLATGGARALLVQLRSRLGGWLGPARSARASPSKGAARAAPGAASRSSLSGCPPAFSTGPSRDDVHNPSLRT